MAYRVEAKTVDRKGNPKAKFSFFGKTKQSALASAKKFFRKAKNCEAAFYDDSGALQPIGSSRTATNAFDTARERAAYAAGLSQGSRSLGKAVGKLREKRASWAERRTKSGLAKNNRRVVRRSSNIWPFAAKTKKKRHCCTLAQNRRPAAKVRRGKHKMPAALARYWKTHRRAKAKNRRTQR